MAEPFKPGPLSASALNAALAEATLNVEGNAQLIRNPGKPTTLFIPLPYAQHVRTYVLSLAASTALPATIGLDTITYDVDPSITSNLMGTLSGGVFTFTKDGFYLLTYFVTVEMILDGATTATPAPVSCTTEIKLGGVTYTAATSACSAAKIPNFDGFVKTDGSALELGVPDLVVETPVLTTQSFVVCDSIGVSLDGEGGFEVTNTCASAITDAELVDGKLQSTPSAGTSDVTTNATAITGSTPSGTAAGTMGGQVLIRVIRNSSGVLKILDGATERSPTVSLYGSVAEGDADCLTASLSILKIY